MIVPNAAGFMSTLRFVSNSAQRRKTLTAKRLDFSSFTVTRESSVLTPAQPPQKIAALALSMVAKLYNVLIAARLTETEGERVM